MREFKFRGKDIISGEWFNGLVQHITIPNQPTVLGIEHLLDNGEYGVIEVDPATVGQYTGLKDKNGTEIYEGDIVRQHFCKETGGYYNEGQTFEGFNVGEVVIIASKGVCLKNPLLHLEVDGEIEQELNKTKMYKNVVRSRCENIGNIHENPELVSAI